MYLSGEQYFFQKPKKKKGNFLGDDWVVITVTLKLKLTLCCWHLLIYSLHYVNTKYLKTKQVQLKQQQQKQALKFRLCVPYKNMLLTFHNHRKQDTLFISST